MFASEAVKWYYYNRTFWEAYLLQREELIKALRPPRV